MTESRFKDQVAVVTGAGQGIGREIALTFARQGARVVLAARSAKLLEEVAGEVDEAGGSALVVPTDVSDVDSVQQLRERVLAEVGRVDVLVANAGIAGPTAPLWEISPEEWDESFAVNVRGVFLCCRAFLPGMLERRDGSVVVIGSMTGKRPLYGRTPYAASKTALIGLVRTLASEVGPAGVRVNLISPGPVAGPRLDRVIANQAAAKGTTADAVRAELTSGSPLGRFVETSDIADAVAFLASDQARSITGEDLNVSVGIVSYG